MVHLITNPTKGPKGVYYYVKRVPKDLIAKIGKERYSISLRTKVTAAKSVRFFPCCSAARII